MKAKQTRWGIIGLGNIAHAFARGLKSAPGAELYAVGSRTTEKAEAFGRKYGARKRYATYQHLADDPNVDAVYIATPHPMHKEAALMCLAAGKAVLCEKPLAVNAAEAKAMIKAAHTHKAFLMEAMWTRFLPTVLQVRDWLEEGRIGEPRMIHADFGFRADNEDEESRLLDPKLAGGALLDVGVYCVSFVSMVFGGPPKDIHSLATKSATKVDAQNAAVLGYDGGRLALISSAVLTNTPQEACIMGTKGMITLESPFWAGKRATLIQEGRSPRTVYKPFRGNGYNYEAEAVMQCLREGKTECDLMPHAESITVMETMDRMRAAWKMKYPME